ncbi:oligopeptide/dipeptide ABC transporter, ATPase subunit [Caldicellulosiruptor hydrothermalis 108]|uniref:Oligopeptide/dipeptide ABC transporter, ATPase subunit n=1 Tax=Caldicellulosiruptor hydrothermalis (strain DSM 18901 / VKM B-2411 / 108) TaxID=632292 RepID=E4Q8C3_CALH1|nr:ABC transporter ATP-binding protein [Caldicellulosiruptor hydrothermalis]ADQ07970.1 oligopeptide/dipeptide ABC transporter, ATPase subunit [Caldicellulosiruptor hydrothermalis 108]
MNCLLEVSSLKAVYLVREGTIKATEDVSFEIFENTVTAIVGESASGKSTIIEAITRTLPPNGRILSGKVFYRTVGFDLLEMKEDELRKIRWKKIALVPQAAQQSLNPTMKIIDHFRDTIEAYGINWSKDELINKASEKIKMVRLNPETVLYAYPMQLSGGMKQRVLIALALLLEPEILILDEPTSALDVLTQAHIVQLLKELKTQMNITLIFVTHDIAVAAELADNIFVIYGGCLVESSPTEKIFKEPKHPYTQGLINSIMAINADMSKVRAIPGDPPSLLNPPSGCRFHPRCEYAMEICKKERPQLIKLPDNVKVACHLYKEGGCKDE